MKKILLLILICILVLCNSNSVYADEVHVVLLPTFPEYNTTDYPYYYIRKWDDGNYTLVILSSTQVNSDGTYLYFNGEYRHCSYKPTTNPDSNEWSTMSNYYNGSSWITQICPFNCDMSNNNIVYSNFDIMYRDTLLRSKLEYTSSGFSEVEDDTLTLSGFISNLGSFFSELFENLAKFFSMIINAIESFANTLLDGFGIIMDNVISFIVNLPSNIMALLQELLVFLFVPSDEFIVDRTEMLEDRFGFILHLKDFFEIINNENVYDGVPKFTINYQGKTYNIIDFSIFENYRSFIRNISSFIMIFYTWLWIVKNGSSLIGNGVASSESVEDFNTYL